MLVLICLDSYSKPKEQFYGADSDEENGPGANQGNVRKGLYKERDLKSG